MNLNTKNKIPPRKNNIFGRGFLWSNSQRKLYKALGAVLSGEVRINERKIREVVDLYWTQE